MRGYGILAEIAQCTRYNVDGCKERCREESREGMRGNEYHAFPSAREVLGKVQCGLGAERQGVCVLWCISSGVAHECTAIFHPALPNFQCMLGSMSHRLAETPAHEMRRQPMVKCCWQGRCVQSYVFLSAQRTASRCSARDASINVASGVGMVVRRRSGEFGEGMCSARLPSCWCSAVIRHIEVVATPFAQRHARTRDYAAYG